MTLRGGNLCGDATIPGRSRRYRAVKSLSSRPVLTWKSPNRMTAARCDATGYEVHANAGRSSDGLRSVCPGQRPDA